MYKHSVHKVATHSLTDKAKDQFYNSVDLNSHKLQSYYGTRIACVFASPLTPQLFIDQSEPI